MGEEQSSPILYHWRYAYMKRITKGILILWILSLLLSACTQPGTPTTVPSTVPSIPTTPSTVPSAPSETDPTVPENGDTVLHVSTTGSDSSDGIAAPLQTVSKALELAAGHIENGNVTILIEGGTYQIREPLNINQTNTSRDAGYVLTLRGGDDTVISGGMQVTGWEKVEGNIWKAHLTDVASVNGFFVNGQRMPLASQKISGDFLDTDRKGGIQLSNRDRYADFSSYNTGLKIIRCAFTTSGTYSLNYDRLVEELPNIRMYFDQTFTRTSFSFSEAIATNNGFTFVADTATLNLLNGAKMADYKVSANRYYLVNSYLFLDEEGEYYFDTDDSTLYFYSKTSPADQECVVPVSEGLLNIQGTKAKLASNVRLENITFEYGTSSVTTMHRFKQMQSDAYVIGYSEGDTSYERIPYPAQITLNCASNITIDGCTFRNFDSTGVALREYVYNTDLIHSDFSNINGSGIAVGTFNLRNGYGITDNYPQPEDLEHVYSVKKNSVIPALIRIENNIIDHCGIDSIGSNGILIYYGYDLQVISNTVSRVGGSGISLGWGWANASIKNTATKNCANILVEKNKVLSSCMRVEDVGGIYTLGAFFGEGCIIRDNFIDMNGALAQHIPTIYLDEGSEWVTATNNVSVNTTMWLHCRALPLVTTGGKVQAGQPAGNTIMNCIISGNYSSIKTKPLGYGGVPWPYASEVIGANVVIEDNIADQAWRDNAAIMEIVNAAGAQR